VDDELADHRVVEGGDHISSSDSTVCADLLFVTLDRRPQVDNLAGGREEVVGGVLGVETSLHGAASTMGAVADVSEDLVLGHGEGLTRGDAQLPLHEVESGDHLRDGVLHLQASVHLAEVEVRGHRVHEELHCPGSNIAARE
jgi:hypothetical protein